MPGYELADILRAVLDLTRRLETVLSVAGDEERYPVADEIADLYDRRGMLWEEFVERFNNKKSEEGVFFSQELKDLVDTIQREDAAVLEMLGTLRAGMRDELKKTLDRKQLLAYRR